MEQLPGLPEAAFDKADPSPDENFYAYPRFVTHIDDGAVAAVTRVYRERLPPGGAVLDLMSSWVSHLPEDIAYASVVGHGMNEEELAANPRFSRWFVQDLNSEHALPFGDAAFDGICLCVSVQYLQRPVDVFREVVRVLRQGAPFVVSFSNRCFPTKAVGVWLGSTDPQHLRLVRSYFEAAGGWTDVKEEDRSPDGNGDPLYAVWARRS